MYYINDFNYLELTYRVFYENRGTYVDGAKIKIKHIFSTIDYVSD